VSHLPAPYATSVRLPETDGQHVQEVLCCLYVIVEVEGKMKVSFEVIFLVSLHYEPAALGPYIVPVAPFQVRLLMRPC
jgi:hypothetical protein